MRKVYYIWILAFLMAQSAFSQQEQPKAEDLSYAFRPGVEFSERLWSPAAAREAFSNPRVSSVIKSKLDEFFQRAITNISDINEIKEWVSVWDESYATEFFARDPEFDWGAFEEKWKQSSFDSFSATEKALVIHAASMKTLDRLQQQWSPNQVSEYQEQINSDPKMILESLRVDGSRFWDQIIEVKNIIRSIQESGSFQEYERIYRSKQDQEFSSFSKDDWQWVQILLREDQFDEEEFDEGISLERMALILGLNSFRVAENAYTWTAADQSQIREALLSREQWGSLSPESQQRVYENTYAYIKKEHDRRYWAETTSPTNFLNPLNDPLEGEGSLTRPAILAGLYAMAWAGARSVKLPRGNILSPHGLKKVMLDNLPKGMPPSQLDSLLKNENRKEVRRTLKGFETNRHFREAFWSHRILEPQAQAARSRIQSKYGEGVAKKFDQFMREGFYDQSSENSPTACRITLGNLMRDATPFLSSRSAETRRHQAVTQFFGENVPRPGISLNPLSLPAYPLKWIGRMRAKGKVMKVGGQPRGINPWRENGRFSPPPPGGRLQVVRAHLLHAFANGGSNFLRAAMIASFLGDGSLVASELLSGVPETPSFDLNPEDLASADFENFDREIWMDLIEELEMTEDLKEVVSAPLFDELRALEAQLNQERFESGLPEVELVLHPRSVSADLDDDEVRRGAPLVSGLFPDVYVLIKVKTDPENSTRQDRLKAMENGVLLRFSMNEWRGPQVAHIGNAEQVYWKPTGATILTDASPRFQEKVSRAISSSDARFSLETDPDTGLPGVWIDPSAAVHLWTRANENFLTED